MGAGAVKPTVLIVEPHLEGTAGHPIRYVRVLAEAFTFGGARVEVLASRRFPKRAKLGAPVTRVFERPIYRTWDQQFGSKLRDVYERLWQLARRVRSTVWRSINALERPVGWAFLWPRVYRTLRIPVRLLRRVVMATALVLCALLLGPFYAVLSAATLLIGRDTTLSTLSPFAAAVLRAVQRAEKQGPVSIVVPTATLGILSELLALPVMHDGPLPRLHLIFHDAPDVWANWYRPTSAEGVAARIRASRWGPLLYFYATTEAAAELLRKSFGPDVYVRSIEDIFTPADLDAIQAAGAAQLAAMTLAPHELTLMEWLAERRTEGLHVALIPGPLRLDKGAQDLPTLISALELSGGEKFALIVQRARYDWLAPYFRNASVHRRVHVVEHGLSDIVMHRLMADADIILLPYRREDYATRISSVLTEAVLHARPILATAGIAMQASLRDTVSCRFVDSWRDWTVAATELIGDAEADRGALVRYRADLDRRLRRRPPWKTLVRDVLAPSPPMYAKPPMILVRPPWLKSGSARLQDEQLDYFAAEGRPIVELIVEQESSPKDRSWFSRAILEDRASSPSGVICFTMARSGLLSRLAFFARRGGAFLRNTYTGQLAEMSRLCPIPPVVLRLARKRVAFALVHHYVRLPFVAPLAKSVPIWLETQDVQAVLHVQHGNVNMVTGTLDSFSDMLADEMRWVRSADAVVAISESELPTFRAHVGAEKIFLCQPPIATKPHPAGAAGAPPSDILLVASDNPGNLASLKWFMAEVWPAVRAAGLNCAVVGNINWRVQYERIDPQDVQFVGVVEHLASWYAGARVVAIPTVEGTGIGIKTIEAMAIGAAIVATPLAYRGLPSDWQKPAPPIDDAVAFAEELKRLCRDARARQALKKRVREAYAELDLANRYRHQMRAIEAHVLAAGEARFGGREDRLRQRGLSPFLWATWPPKS